MELKPVESPLEVLFDSNDFIAINKPHGLLVHRSPMAKDAKEFALQKVRNMVGAKVYLVHRLDRKTSGVLLFAKNKEANEVAQKQFRERTIKKEYVAIVRGFIREDTLIDYPLVNNDKKQEAITLCQSLQLFEIPLPFAGFETSRYSLVKLIPKTGRHHQLRKHMAHIFHPIIGDRPHGCNKQNKLWKEEMQMDAMLLHAKVLQFHFQNEELVIHAGFSTAFADSLSFLETNDILKQG